jgi:hypothetical protein
MSLAVVVACLAPKSAGAQILRGRVVTDTAGVSGARVTVRDSAAWRTEIDTDTTGVFAIELPHAGTFVIDAALGGSGVAGPDSLVVEAREEVLLTIRLDAPVTLEPIEVYSRRLYGSNVTRAGLEERWATARTLGLGHIFTREDLDARPTVYVHDMIRSLPGVYLMQGLGFVRVQFRKSGDVCFPQVWVDGVRDVDGQSMLDRLDPDDVEAVEVYRRASFAPPEYIDDSGCGSILAWTRRDTRGGSPLTWRRVAAFVGLVGFTLFLRNNYY